ncbi:odorant receptor 170 [Nasonia vitripennis]|nr:odorant receptor 170 [Nasonia vitripennis]
MELKVERKAKSGLREEDIFNNKYFILNKKLLALVGLWPYQDARLKRVVRILLVLCIYSMMIPQMMKGIEECREKNPNPEIILENISGFFYFQGVTAKFLTAILTEDKLKYVYEEVMKDWKRFTDKNEIAILCKFAHVGRVLTVVWSIYAAMSCLLFVTLPAVIPMILNIILTRNETFKKSLCIYCEYYIDQDKYFFYIFLHHIIAGIATIFLTIGIDTSYVNCVQHVLALFNVSSYRLKVAFDTIHHSKKNDYNLKTLENNVHSYVVSSIRLHQRSIKFVDTIQSAYNIVFFIVCALLLFGISIITVDLVWNVHNPINLIRIACLWMGTIMYMFYSNWPGQKLIDSSNELFDAIYTCGWFEFPMKTKILIRFMLLRSIDPCRLTAGPLLQMNFESCSLILRSAMSYFTVLVTTG